MNDFNKVIIRGKILNKYRTRNDHIILTIKTCKHNFPAVFFPKAVSADLADTFECGQDVEIVGSLQSTKKDNFYSCSIFGTDIRAAENDDTRNYFELSGRIIKFESFNGLIKLMIESDTEHYSTVPVVFYNKKYEETLMSKTVGERLSIRGVVQTKRIIDLNSDMHFYVNFVGYACA